jgi:Dolichyl-phosphate-mannose-protein mannosyltransferase
LRVMPAVIWRPIARLIAGNRLFAAVLLLAAALRADAELGYRWQSWFNDSFTYLRAAVTLTPGTTRPAGYPVYLWLLSPAHSYLLVTASQHLMGLLVAVMIYALARHRFAVPAWIAVLATLPVLFDGFELELEHLIMADTLFLFLAMAAVTIVLWSPRPSWRACLAAGLLLGVASTVRPTGLPLLAVFLLYLLIRLLPARPIRWRSLPSGAQPGGTNTPILRPTGEDTPQQGQNWSIRPGGRPPGWQLQLGGLAAALAACALAFAVPVAGYEGWYKSAHGEFAMTDSTGVFLYSRVMTFADCSRLSLPPDLRPLCTSVPPGQRPIAQAYIWTSASPLLKLPEPMFSPTVDKLAERFAVRAIEAQPLDYARAVWDDTVRSFEWNRPVFPNPQTYDAYLFGYQSHDIPVTPYRGYKSAAAYYVRGNPATVVVSPFAQVIRGYQRYVWLPGTIYGLILLAGLFGIARRRWEAALPWLCSLALIVVPAATAEFDYRYVTTAAPLACLAAAMAFGPAGLARRGTGGGPDGRLADASHDKRDLAADAT